jgi:hypothetical protein
MKLRQIRDNASRKKTYLLKCSHLTHSLNSNKSITKYFMVQDRPRDNNSDQGVSLPSPTPPHSITYFSQTFVPLTRAIIYHLVNYNKVSLTISLTLL